VHKKQKVKNIHANALATRRNFNHPNPVISRKPEGLTRQSLRRVPEGFIRSPRQAFGLPRSVAFASDTEGDAWQSHDVLLHKIAALRLRAALAKAIEETEVPMPAFAQAS